MISILVLNKVWNTVNIIMTYFGMYVIRSVFGKQMILFASRIIVVGVMLKENLFAVGGYASYSVKCCKKISC